MESDKMTSLVSIVDEMRYVPMAPVESDDQFLDRCAIAAMHGRQAANVDLGHEVIAQYAYNAAEFMLAERNKRRANRAK